MPTERVDAVVAGDELGLALAEELERLAPFGIGNPSVSLLVPAARLVDARPMGEEGRHVRFTVEAGGHRARAVAFGDQPAARRRRPRRDVHAGAQRVERRGRAAAGPAPRPGARRRRRSCSSASPRTRWPPRWPSWRRRCRWRARRRARPASRATGAAAGVAGTLAALVASGEPVLVACADARRRRGHLEGRLGGFAVAAWHALERDPALDRALRARRRAGPAGRPTAQAALVDERFTVAWGDAEAAVRARAPTRPATTCARRPPPSTAPCATAPLPDAVAAAPSPAAAGRALRVLAELGPRARRRRARRRCSPARRTELDASAAFRAYTTRLAEGRARLAAPRRAARAA